LYAASKLLARDEARRIAANTTKLPKLLRKVVAACSRLAVALLGLTGRTKPLLLPEKTIYLRTDGQDMAGNSALHEQFELDRVTCQTDPGDTRDCMAVKGYVAVPKDQAAAKQRQLAAIAAQNAQQETVSEPPALRSTTAPKSLAGKKQKPKPAEITSTSSQN